MSTFRPLLSAAALALAATALAPVTAYAQDDAAVEHTATEESHAMTDHAADAAEVTVIDLTQVPGEFTTETLELDAGQYQFAVTNDGVDHELGFVIQKAEDADGDVMATAVENSFTTETILDGDTQKTGVVTLTPGEYVYSCPLNPTPHYKLIVK